MSKQSPQGAVYAEESHAGVISFFNRPNFGDPVGDFRARTSAR